jgi:oligoendopeptidase F
MNTANHRRIFVDDNLLIDSFESVAKYLDNLVERKLESPSDLKKWLKDKSELEAVLEEDMAWRYIRMSIDTTNNEFSEAYNFFVSKIQPKLAPYDDQLNQKLMNCPYHKELEEDPAYAIYFRGVKSQLELYREENISIQSYLSQKSQEFGSISGAQSIEHDGKTLTMPQASILLKEQDESLRKEVFDKISSRRSEDIEALDELYSELIQKRTELAKNAGFENYRDYKFKDMGRFDYTTESCIDFHNAVERHIVPLVKGIQQKKLIKLKKERFKPWDTAVNPDGKAPLKPFKTGKEMLDQTIAIFDQVDSKFAGFLKTMEEMEHFDLESKPGKAPGGYNYPLYESGAPFIFMNSVGSQNDFTTMIHEGGHAVHSFLTHNLELTSFKSFPSEIAELASMSMELLTMDYWDQVYSDKNDLTRAQREQIEGTLTLLPWIAQIDAFQHWIYENHNHTVKERSAYWMTLNQRFGTGLVDWQDYEQVLESSWQRQLHLFEVPFYYIEYGIAQLGAIGVWKNSKSDFSKAVGQYENALKLGYTKSMPHVFKAAGISFDFSGAHICKLAEFVGEELEKLEE